MRILSFAASNHRSFPEEFVLDLTRPEFTTKLPLDGSDWADVTYPVAAIYGANASGKTSIIRALTYFRAAILSSAGKWHDADEVKRDPFLFSDEHKNGESRYRLEYTMDVGLPYDPNLSGEKRYAYEFAIAPDGIVCESLHVYLSRRPTTLFDRNGSEEMVKLHAILGGKSLEVARGELALSRALAVKRTALGKIARQTVDGIAIYTQTGRGIQSQITGIIDEVKNRKRDIGELVTLARVADVGISNATLQEAELPPQLIKLLENLNADHTAAEHNGNVDGDASAVPVRRNVQMRAVSMQFQHRTEKCDHPVALDFSRESAGTIAWLAIGVSMIDALRKGSVLVIDEFETSLHPNLASMLLAIFEDRQINRHGAQLIVTTHHASFLSPESQWEYELDQIWIVEKGRGGDSQLYSLADFADLDSGLDISRYLLEGRLGGTPRLAPALIDGLVDVDCEEG